MSLLVLLLVACGAPGGRTGTDAGVSTEPLADFSLLDVNPASPSSGQNVSPRNFQGRVSAWYFGHSS
jgi:hypothetical protein